MTSGGLWNYYRDETNDDKNENGDDGNKLNSNKTTTGNYYRFKTKIIGSTPDNANSIKVEVVVPLRYLSNIWLCPDVP